MAKYDTEGETKDGHQTARLRGSTPCLSNDIADADADADIAVDVDASGGIGI